MAHSTTTTQATGGTQGRMILVIVLAVIAVLAIIAGAIYLAEPAKSLPSVLGTITHPAARANATRSTRGWVALAFGVVCAVGAWFARPGRTRAARG